MDLFKTSSDPRETYVTLAARIREGISRSTKVMKEEVRAAFLQLTDAGTIWGFSLLLSGWQLRGHSEVAGLLAPYSLTPLYEQLGAVPLLADFTLRAERAGSAVDLAGASAYFAAAVENVGVSLLRIALSSPQFVRARDVLLRAFPEEETMRKVGSAATAGAGLLAAGKGRARHFDDFGLRAGRRTEPPRRAQVDHGPGPAPLTASSESPLPTLDLPELADTRAAAMEWLGDVGYEPAQIEAILQRRIRFT